MLLLVKKQVLALLWLQTGLWLAQNNAKHTQNQVAAKTYKPLGFSSSVPFYRSQSPDDWKQILLFLDIVVACVLGGCFPPFIGFVLFKILACEFIFRAKNYDPARAADKCVRWKIPK